MKLSLASLAGIWTFCEQHPGIILVFAGVVGEILAAWKRPQTRKEAWEKFFSIVLIAGLVLEIGEAIKEDKQVAVLSIKASEAMERAGNAEKDAAQANERAAKFDADRVMVEKEAEEIKSTNFVLQARVLELEKNQQDRTINQGQIDKFKAALANAPRGPVWVVNAAPSRETGILTADMRRMLDDAGYSVKGSSWAPSGFGAGAIGNGVLILLAPLPIPIQKDAIGCIATCVLDATNMPPQAVALAEAFDAAGIKMVRSPASKDLVESGQTVVIILGK